MELEEAEEGDDSSSQASFVKNLRSSQLFLIILSLLPPQYSLSEINRKFQLFPSTQLIDVTSRGQVTSGKTT